MNFHQLDAKSVIGENTTYLTSKENVNGQNRSEEKTISNRNSELQLKTNSSVMLSV